MAVEVGQEAPDFELKDQHGQPVKLSSFRGQKNVVLVFYPLAFSGVCSGEMRAMRDDFPEVERDDVELLTVSVDSTYAHRVWAETEGFEFGLLSDFWPHGGVAARYGVFDEDRGLSVRGRWTRCAGTARGAAESRTTNRSWCAPAARRPRTGRPTWTSAASAAVCTWCAGSARWSAATAG